MKFFRYFVAFILIYTTFFNATYSKVREDEEVSDHEVEQIIDRAEAMQDESNSDSLILRFFDDNRVTLTHDQVITLSESLYKSQDYVLETYARIRIHFLTVDECISLSEAISDSETHDSILKYFAETNFNRLTSEDLISLAESAQDDSTSNSILAITPGILSSPKQAVIERKELLDTLLRLKKDAEAANSISISSGDAPSLAAKVTIDLILKNISQIKPQLNWLNWLFSFSKSKLATTNLIKGLENDLYSSIKLLHSAYPDSASLLNEQAIIGRGASLILKNTPPSNIFRRKIATFLAANPDVKFEISLPRVLVRQIMTTVPSNFQLEFEVKVHKEGSSFNSHRLVLWIRSTSIEESLINEMDGGKWIDQFGEDTGAIDSPNSESLGLAVQFIHNLLPVAPPTVASKSCAVEVKKIPEQP